jgi:hypothetical protein
MSISSAMMAARAPTAVPPKEALEAGPAGPRAMRQMRTRRMDPASDGIAPKTALARRPLLDGPERYSDAAATW